jgi:ubiquinone/menaquinone biosynthesis C-methylase UbiE
MGEVSMSYTANKVYKNKNVAENYDNKRFVGLKGKLIDWREKSLIYNAIKLSGIIPPAKLIDIPCGTARLSISLAEKGYNVIGVDVSPAMIEQGEDKLEKLTLEGSVKFKVGDGELLPLPDGTADLGISLRLFGHLPSDVRVNVLKELNRVSKSFVIVAYYHANSVQRYARKKMREKSGYPWHSVSINQIDAELAQANLERIKTSFVFPFISETIIILAKKI